MSDNEELFPRIGDVVEKTERLPDDLDSRPAPPIEEEKPVQEVESLCMNCGENVSCYCSHSM